MSDSKREISQPITGIEEEGSGAPVFGEMEYEAIMESIITGRSSPWMLRHMMGDHTHEVITESKIGEFSN